MRATGIVRRIDDLGRIILTKEIRRSMHIKEGDALTIYINPEDNEIILKKYNCDCKEQLEDNLKNFINSLDIDEEKQFNIIREAEIFRRKLEKFDY